MSELIYIDTNIYIDYFLNRKDNLRPLGDFAHELFIKTSQCKYKIIISDWLEKELTKTNHIDSYKELKNHLIELNKITYVKTEFKEISCAKKHQHWHDALHEMLAIKANAVYFVTRNIRDFTGNKIIITHPENL